jgi:TM2 domain-containing membrane protein YozV/uncharacterized protein YraI
VTAIKVNANSTQWPALRAKAFQRGRFLPSLNEALKECTILILLIFSLETQASDFYISKSDLNIRSGASKNYKTITVIEKGDTVEILENISEYWVKVQYQDKIGFAARQYLQPIEIIEIVETEKDPEIEVSNSFFVFLILITFVTIIAFILRYSGDKHRKKSVAILLSLLFGAFGFQKFYLGQTIKGIYSIIFCWTFIPLLIGLIDVIKFVKMNDVKFNDRYNGSKTLQGNTTTTTIKPKIAQKLNQQYISPPRMITNKKIHEAKDESIIDVSSEKLDLKVERNTIQDEVQMVPPYWAQTYVYSYDEIRNANQAQKEYYYYLKNKVLNGEIVDIQGYTNYAFILYFDFLTEYQSHRDIKLLEEHFKLIGQICPKTKSYTSFLLRNELRKRNDSYSVDKLKNLEEPNYQFDYDHSDYNPDLYKLGNKYKDKLGLDKQEINWLNKFYNPSNVFLSIEGCCIATIRQYVTVLKELDKRFKKAETTLAKEVKYFKDKLKSLYANRNSGWGYYDASYLGNQAESEVYLIMFKRIENSVRESFGHKRKVSGDFSNVDKNLSEEFEKRIGSLINELIEKFKSNLGKPDLETQIELNIQNVTRWQIELDELKKSFNPELKNNFVEGIIHLEETNQKNPNIENIFFEASKFIASYDKVQSLSYFAKYIYYDLKSKSFDNKELAKTVQKSLFKTQEQLDDFKAIIAELIKTSDIQTALEKIAKIYVPKRKKIHLDKSEIEEVEQKHEGTVELLNGYLNSEKEEAITEINATLDKDIEVTIIPTEEKDSIFISEISIGKVQEELIKKIVTNSFKIHQVEVNNFANENQMFKNQLIDSINESFAAYLDGEALIEEDGENYIMEKTYFKIIAK